MSDCMDRRRRQFLFVGGDRERAERLGHALAQANGAWTQVCAATVGDASAVLSGGGGIDAVVLDAESCGSEGAAFLEELRAKFPAVTPLRLGLTSSSTSGAGPPAAKTARVIRASCRLIRGETRALNSLTT